MPTTIRLPNGEEVDINTDDPKQAASAAQQIWQKHPDYEPSWRETLSTARENLSLDKLAQASFSNPVEDVKNLGKAVLGGAENLLGYTPQQQISNEQDVANAVGEHYGNYFSEKGLKKNISQDPIATAEDVLSFGLAPARAAARAGARVVTPFPARPGFGAASDALAAEGVRTTAGQRTGNVGLKYAESELGGGRTATALDQQGEQFTRAASRRIGEDTPHLDPETLNNAYTRIGNDFDAIGNRNFIPTDRRLGRDVHLATQQYNLSVPQAANVPMVQRLTADLNQAARTGLTGDQFVTWRSRLARLGRETKDPQLQAVYGDMREALENAMERSMRRRGNHADIEAFRTARRQYSNYLVLENAMATGAGDTARGILTPAKLEAAAAAGPRRRWYARGLSDFSGLGKAGRVGMSPMPQSGTAPRTVVNAVPAALGALAAGGGSGGLGAAAGALGGRFVAGRALMSRPMQAYLGNQWLPYSPEIPGRGGIAAPLLALSLSMENQ